MIVKMRNEVFHTGEVCSLGDVKNRFYLKDGELVNDFNVAAVGTAG